MPSKDWREIGNYHEGFVRRYWNIKITVYLTQTLRCPGADAF